MYRDPSWQNHVTSIVSSDLMNPCIKGEVGPIEIGSLTINWSSFDKMGIANPPAESIAAVDPAAVETLRPLDLVCTKEDIGFSFCMILLTEHKGRDIIRMF